MRFGYIMTHPLGRALLRTHGVWGAVQRSAAPLGDAAASSVERTNSLPLAPIRSAAQRTPAANKKVAALEAEISAAEAAHTAAQAEYDRVKTRNLEVRHGRRRETSCGREGRLRQPMRRDDAGIGRIGKASSRYVSHGHFRCSFLLFVFSSRSLALHVWGRIVVKRLFPRTGTAAAATVACLFLILRHVAFLAISLRAGACEVGRDQATRLCRRGSWPRPGHARAGLSNGRGAMAQGGRLRAGMPGMSAAESGETRTLVAVRLPRPRSPGAPLSPLRVRLWGVRGWLQSPHLPLLRLSRRSCVHPWTREGTCRPRASSGPNPPPSLSSACGSSFPFRCTASHSFSGADHFDFFCFPIFLATISLAPTAATRERAFRAQRKGDSRARKMATLRNPETERAQRARRSLGGRLGRRTRRSEAKRKMDVAVGSRSAEFEKGGRAGSANARAR